ncbi:hypothetical protein GALL_41780 [mine drainage metagenome]|uniref:Glycosyltransferase subfamily 4-like N-terminal domain-containing protein n=1 Tax=mine drainage metagenome TaxID=410659 RepID=A0A1J5T4K1_9ZZZZ
MRRVLIVSPHWAPVNAPDLQRARLGLPYYREHGWEPVVLALAPESVEGAVIDPLLEQTYPADIRIVRVRGIPPTWTRWAGVGNLWWRCGRALAEAGERLLASERFDLVFFTTTQFSAFTLGPRWKRRFGVPYVLDYQDPWRNDYYRDTRTRPPGGRLKFALSQLTARRHEERVLREASGVIAVSQSYGPMLARYYPWFDAASVAVLPFGTSEADFEIARSHKPAAPLIDFSDGNFHHVYTGRCGPDMRFAMNVIFRAFKRYLQADFESARRHRFHFIGTDYAPPPLGHEWAMPVAREVGVADYVHEHCYRVPYFDALHYLTHADALIGVGSNDPTYSASKIFPYILARRPMLLVFHQDSLVSTFTRRVGAGRLWTFSGPGDIDRLAEEVLEGWFRNAGGRDYRPFDEEAFGPMTASHLTASLARVFDAAARRSVQA